MRHASRRLFLSIASAAALAAGALATGPTSALAAADQAAAPAFPANPAQLVDTRFWTTGGGNTFPGADVPWGMVQWSPDTMPNRNAGGGYGFGDSMLMGYSLTHVSGPGCGAAGDVPMLPMTGPLPAGDPNAFTTSFTNTAEVAQAGYYAAESNLPATITSEFAETPHSAMGRFTYPATAQAGFLIKLMASQNGQLNPTAQVVGTNEVMGSETSGGFCGDPGLYTLSFDVVFDQPFTASQVVTQGGAASAVLLTFDTTRNPVVQAKVGISYVSPQNARANWQQENPGWSFGRVRGAAQAAWNRLLGRIQVGADAATQRKFYSLLYKVFVQPNVTSDVNGEFVGSDRAVHTLAAGQRNQYGMFSGWDTYHATAQLQAMLDPAAASDQATSQLNYYAENGILQQWGYLHLDNYVMVGDPTQAIIADYYAFGARGFDQRTALADMLKQATTVNDVRPGQALEDQLGYLPQNGSYHCSAPGVFCNPHGFVSALLEYDNADFALSQFARALGDTKNADMLQNRANNWLNEFNPSTGLITPRLVNGSFMNGITPMSGAPTYVEGTAYQYTWDVPNDYAGLFSLLGGNTKVAAALEQYLSQPNGDGMFAQLGNEFDLGEQFAPDYAGDPAGTQQAVNNIRNSLYGAGAAGLPNNDDLGSMSATYVWSMLGMYPENPGSGNLVFASPGVPKARINLPSGRRIEISAPGASPTRFYVQSLRLNGAPYQRLFVPFSTLAAGATMDWTLGTARSAWGTAPQDAPPSYGPVFADTATVTTPGGQLVLQPGQSGTATLTVRSVTSAAQTVTFTASAPQGVTVSPSTGSLSVPANGSASATVTITAGQTDGSFPVAFDLTTSAPGERILPVPFTVVVARPGDLAPFYNVTGISDDAAPTAANYDGGGASYSEQALTAAGLPPGATVTSGGLTYTWPNAAPGQPDGIFTSGQRIPLSAPAGARTIGFLGSAIDAGTAGSQGTVTITYTDGTTSTGTLGLSDWTLGGGAGTPQFGNVPVATMPYRNVPSGKQMVQTFVFATTIPADGGRTIASVTLPDTVTAGQIGVFAIAAG
jgi:predicted alpha-1,2-mannosidase